MFAVVTVSAHWLREHWIQLKKDGYLRLALSSWDDGDALAPSDLGAHPACVKEHASVQLGPALVQTDGRIQILLEPLGGSKVARQFQRPGWHALSPTCSKIWMKSRDRSEVCMADVQPELNTRRKGILESTILQDKTVLLSGLGLGRGARSY